MPPCKIDAEASPSFRALLLKLQRKYPRVIRDVTAAFEKIEKDFDSAAYANRIPGLPVPVFKYRHKCSDQQKGAREGIRIVAYFDSGTGILYPLLIYVKSEKTDVSLAEVREAIRELRDDLRGR